MRNYELAKVTQPLPIQSILWFGFFVSLGIVIWLTQSNQELFLILNSHHAIMPDALWGFLNLLSYSKFFILQVLLLLLSYFKCREKFYNVVFLILAYYLLFALLKSLVGEARPYIVLPEGSFFWLNHFENAAKSAHKSFPSGHTGNMAVFVFAMNSMFFAGKKGAQFLMLLLLFATAFARIFTGWHWPLDVLASGLIGYLLVQICMRINVRKNFAKS